MNKIIFILLAGVFLASCGAISESTPAPITLGTPTKPSRAACSPPSSWTIEYSRSGGIGGFSQAMTLKSDGSLAVKSDHPALDKQMTIPEDHVTPITNLLIQACPFEASPEKGVCADCFNYELIIQMEGQTYSIQATDTTLSEDLRLLVSNLDEFIQFAGQ